MRMKTKRNELQRQREQRGKELQHMRDWIHSHPHRVDPEVQPAAIDFLNNSIAELEMKNTRRPGRVQLRDRLRLLLVSIVTQTPGAGK